MFFAAFVWRADLTAFLLLILPGLALAQSCPGASLQATQLRVETEPVLLNPADPAQSRLGDFEYAGGLVLRAEHSELLHGLSDLDFTGAEQIAIVGDRGLFFEARLLHDAAGRLVGLTDLWVRPMQGEQGKPLCDKEEADAEGLAILPNGDRLVSFERQSRILLYPADGSQPQPVPAPENTFPKNGGMEALAYDPEAGAAAYLAGAENTAEIWRCELAGSCRALVSLPKPAEFSLVSIKRLEGNLTAYLLRAFDPATSRVRIQLRILRAAQPLAKMELTQPLSVDNFEGLAVVQQKQGYRFYLLSDDNYSSRQRTLLLAFDWNEK